MSKSKDSRRPSGRMPRRGVQESVLPRGGVRRDPRAESVPPEARITMPTRADKTSRSAPPKDDDEPAPRLVAERMSTRIPSAVAMLEAELARERQERASDQDQIAKMLVRVAELDKRAKDAEARVAELESANKAKTKKPSIVPMEDAGVRRKFADLESQIVEAESRLALAQSAAEKSTDRARAAEERNLEVIERIAALQAQLGAARDDAKASEEKIEAIEQRLRAAESHAKEIEERASAAAEEAADKEKELADARAKLRHADESVAAMDASFREAEQDRDRLGSMMTKLGEQLTTIQARDREHTKELEALEAASARVVVLLEQLDAREKNVAVYRGRAIAEARDLLQGKGAPTKATSNPFEAFDEKPKRGVTPPPIPKIKAFGHVVDVSGEAIEIREDEADDED